MSVALVGAGYWGSNHLKILSEDLAVICDVDQLALDRLDEKFKNIPKVTNIDEVWSIPSVKRIVIATPLNTHYGLVKEALNHHLDVLVEKPFVKTTREAKELCDLAQSQGKILMVGHMVNYHPIVPLLIDLIQSEKYGRLRKIECRHIGGAFISRPSVDVDVMWNLGTHDVSLSMNLLRQSLFELDESSVKAMHSTSIGLLHDTVFTNASFVNPKGEIAMVEIHATLHGEKERMLTLVLDDAVVSWNCNASLSDKTQLKVIERRSSPNGEIRAVPHELDVPDLGTRRELERELDCFHECCTTRRKPLTDGREGDRVIRFLELVSACVASRTEATLKKINVTDRNVFSNKSESTKAFVHPTSVVDRDASIGKGTKIWHFCHVSNNCSIGENCIIGQNCYFGVGAIIGDDCKVQNNVSVYAGVECEDGVFLGPSMVFTNVKTPRATHPRPFEKTLVKKGSTIGANVTIVCGITLGEYCMIGAGAVVTKSVEPYSLVYGNPATHRGWVDKNCNIVEQSPIISGESQGIPTFTTAEEWKLINQDVRKGIDKVLENGKFINGREVSDLEKELAEYVQVPFCVTVANGTNALQIALMAATVGRGDEVIVPTYTFIATAEAVSLVGAIPVFVDILQGTHNIDPQAVEDAITSKTKAVIAVSLFGVVAPLMEIRDILAKLGRTEITLIEDAAQSFGAERYGRRSCSIADISCTSFFPTKPLGCFGDGGAIFTADEQVATKLRLIANHGRSSLDVHICLGFNSRLDTIQAAVLLTKMRTISDSLSSRKNVAKIYHEYLRSNKRIILPTLSETCVYAQFSIQFRSQSLRDHIKSELSKAGIQSRIYWPTQLHLQPVFINTECVIKPCPVAEETCNTTLSLPIYPYMKEADTIRVASTLNDLLNSLKVTMYK